MGGWWANTLISMPLAESASVLDELSNRLSTVNSLILILAGWVGIAAVMVVVLRILRLRRRRQLVVSTFVNASGLPELDSTVQGLGYLVRERLVQHLISTQRQLRESAKRTSLPPSLASAQSPAPSSTSDEQVKDLVASLRAYVPQPIAPIIQLLNDVALRPLGTRVAGTLQQRGTAASRIGITLELTDLRGEQEPSVETVWETAANETGAQGTAQERLITLIEPAARLLARRLVAQELLRSSGLPASAGTRRDDVRLAGIPGLSRALEQSMPRGEYEALVRNFIGMLLQGDALTYQKAGLAPSFFVRAIAEFDRAIELAPLMYQPYENRADTYALQAQTDPVLAPGLLAKAMLDYSTAQERARALPSLTRPAVEHRLQIGQYLAQLRTGDSVLIQLAAERVAELEAFAGSELDDQFLYNLACWHGLSFRMNKTNVEAGSKTLRFLVYCFVRDRTRNRRRWSAAEFDSDLETIHSLLPRLRLALSLELSRPPRLSEMVGEPFIQRIEGLLSPILVDLDTAGSANLKRSNAGFTTTQMSLKQLSSKLRLLQGSLRIKISRKSNSGA
jgi:hypothetical protein